MNAPFQVDATARNRLARYREVRQRMPALAEGLSAEDLAAQSMPDASPGKWHLGHTSWFFEAMILARDPDYEAVDQRLQRMFNSYYEALGERVDRPERGLMTRPGLDEVLSYRREIDRRMTARLALPLDADEAYLFELGLHHDQHHQELFLMDLLHLMSRSPLDPAAYVREPRANPPEPALGGVERFDEGLVQIGADQDVFAFDNERPRHRTWLEAFGLSRDLTTNGDWLAFIENGGYRRAELWLSDGWTIIQREGWAAPLYWRCDDGAWTTMGLTGRTAVESNAPVRHISLYEADAFARWKGARLPTEAEWEVAAVGRPSAFSNLMGESWQWTSSAYNAYPGFRPTQGTASEYNGKFMANQMVLRGASFATPVGHDRATYRNFFHPHQRWAFTGLRLAWD